jgi:hypothetical protein
MCLVFATHHSKATYCFMLSHLSQMLFSKKNIRLHYKQLCRNECEYTECSYLDSISSFKKNLKHYKLSSFLVKKLSMINSKPIWWNITTLMVEKYLTCGSTSRRPTSPKRKSGLSPPYPCRCRSRKKVFWRKIELSLRKYFTELV